MRWVPSLHGTLVFALLDTGVGSPSAGFPAVRGQGTPWLCGSLPVHVDRVRSVRIATNRGKSNRRAICLSWKMFSNYRASSANPGGRAHQGANLLPRMPSRPSFTWRRGATLSAFRPTASEVWSSWARGARVWAGVGQRVRVVHGQSTPPAGLVPVRRTRPQIHTTAPCSQASWVSQRPSHS